MRSGVGGKNPTVKGSMPRNCHASTFGVIDCDDVRLLGLVRFGNRSDVMRLVAMKN